MGNGGSSSLAGTAIKVAAAAGAAALALEAWSYASSLLSQFDPDGRKPKTSTESAEEISSQQPETFLSDDCEAGVELVDYHILPDPKPVTCPQGTIKIMSYNVWSIKYIKIIKRMKAIDKLIQKHSPDIILLQEVTPLIYDLFQKCNWWGSYRCSVPQEKATTKSFFCMMMSKLHEKKFYCKHLENTTTGRGLCVAIIGTGGAKQIVVATCHLKSPQPPDMHSEERVSQANDAISILHNARNVVLGGDMNWDESSDGPFPLRRKWRDAWSSLRAGEDGWTYDTESNGMLNHRRQSLQMRLDRFVCKLKDFEMVGIEMIGTEAIPGVWYKSKGTKLPVFPSDHYGLILTICPKQ